MIGRWSAALAGAAGALAIVASSAGAQQVPAPAVPQPQPQTPPGWLLVPTIGVAQVWDDNVSLAVDGGDVAEDYVTAVSPSLAIDYRGRRTTFGVDYDGIYDFYNDLSELNSSNQRARVELTRRAGARVSLFARDNFTLAPTTEDLAVAALVLQRRTSRFNDFRGGAEFMVGRHTTLTAAYTSQWIGFERDDEVAPLLRGGHSNGATLDLRRQFSERLSLGGRYAYQRALVSQGDDEFDIQDAAVSLEWAASRTLVATLEGGYAWLSAGRTSPRRQAPTFRAGLAWQAGRSQLGVEYGRAFLPSFGFGGTVENEELTGTLRVPLTRRIEWSAGASLRENDPLTAFETSLRSVIAQSSVVFLATRWMKVEIFGTHSFQDSRLAGGRIARTRAGIQIATSRAMRVR